MDWNAALTSISTALVVAKAIKDIDAAYDAAVYKGQIAELLNSLADVKISLIDGQEELRLKDLEIKRLEAALAARRNLLDGPGGYKWLDQGDGIRRGYPICPSCDDSEGRQVQLLQAGEPTSTSCPRCKSAFEPVEFFFEPDANGVQKTHSQVRREEEEAQRARSNAAMRNAGSWLG